MTFDDEPKGGRAIKKYELMATNYAAAINQLAESRYFDDAVKAAREKDKTALRKACINAGISEEMAEKMSVVAIDSSAIAAMCW